MTPNPFSSLLHSRKFWLTILDLTVSIVLYFVGKYAGPSAFDDVKFLIFALQPVFVTIIIGITLEDRALIAAGAAK
jgi:hypothetical protein